MRIAGIEPESIVDGPGVRYAVFAQGCSLHCRGCQNPASWDPCGGAVMPVEEIMADMRGATLAQGLTLTGGEASEQAADAAVLARHAHEIGWDVWCWSGHRFEVLLRRAQTEPDLARLFGEVDVLVDGPFLLARRTLALTWRGSDNQRLIDVPASLAAGTAVEWEENSTVESMQRQR